MCAARKKRDKRASRGGKGGMGEGKKREGGGLEGGRGGKGEAGEGGRGKGWQAPMYQKHNTTVKASKKRKWPVNKKRSSDFLKILF